MKAFVINRFGPAAEVFEEVELPKPAVGPRQVLIEVAASGINPLDFKLRRGDFPGFTHEFPAILHGDVAGTVIEIGSEVDDFAVGDRVYGCAGGIRGRQGALADYMLADAALLAHQPQSLSAADAAVLPLVAISAWEGLIDRIALKPGDKVLIHAGTGGVGHVAAQLAKWKGAQVFTTVSSAEKAALSREFGADVTIDYRTSSVQDYVATHTGGAGFDVVFDTVGGATFENSLHAAKVGGQVISTLAQGTLEMTAAWGRKLSIHCVNMSWPMATGIGMEHHGFILREVARLVDEGRIKPLVDPRRFSFAAVAEAHAYAESGQALGKISLTRT